MITQDCIRKSKCRVDHDSLVTVLDLGEICLNDFPADDEDDSEKYPLELTYSPSSELVQLRHTVDPELMFRNYWYASGTQEAMQDHLKEIVNEIQQRHHLKHGDVVLDIGCNDGTLLNFYRSGVYQVGFEPARNLRADIDCLVPGFFDARTYKTTDSPRAKVVTAVAMFYDIDDPVDFVSQVNHVMDDDGLFVLEMHYLPEMLKNNEVDAICHEHLAYYSLNSLQHVMRRAGMTVVDVELNMVNGGSMLVYVKKANRSDAPSAKVNELMIEEVAGGWLNQLRGFAERIEQNKIDLRVLLERLSEEGKKVYGYGASTKGNTLLQYCEITPELLPKIADRNPAKHGRVTVRSRIPIISEEQMREEKPDYLLALPYHFIESFQKREQDFQGQWIVPVPTPHIIS